MSTIASCIFHGDKSKCPDCILFDKIQSVVDKIKLAKSFIKLRELEIELNELTLEIGSNVTID